MPEALDHLRAALADHYAIERELGRGGMATVYLAQDQKHKRKVAVKVLRSDLAAALGAERFLREVEVTASLQHPNILPLYDSGVAGDVLYYVMPFLEGESLRQRLDRERQLPVDETVAIARAIAAALHFAHEHGVVHRDIKPENILFQAGQAIVADFGIALALSQAGDSRMTETGLSLGTTRYMSPEQATGGHELDARSDVYSLGAVTYEMLTGDPPHKGKTAQAIVARILTEVPAPIGESRTMVPGNVDAAVQVALAKVPADRFSTAERFARALDDPGFTLPSASAHPQPMAQTPLARLGWPVTAMVLLVALLSTMLGGPEAPPRQVTRAVLSLGDGQDLGTRTGLAIADDGAFFVYPGSADVDNILWLRSLDEAEAHPIPGTEGGNGPTISPDGREVAFWTRVGGAGEGALKVVSLEDGSVRVLTDSIRGPVTDWGPDDQLYFRGRGGLMRISADGGAPELVAAPDSSVGETGYNHPHVLPNDRGILLGGSQGGLFVLDLQTFEVERLGVLGGSPKYVPGYMLYRAREGGEWGHYAIPFDAEKLEVVGDPRKLPFNPKQTGFGIVGLAVSPNGTLVYISWERRERDLVWVARDGTERLVDPGRSELLISPRVSPDGSAIVGELWGLEGTRPVGIKEVDGGQVRSVSHDIPTPGRPAWHPDGTRVSFTSGRALVVAPLNGTAPTFFDFGMGVSHGIWSPDGQWLVAQAGGAFTPNHLYIRHTHPDSVVRPLLTSGSGDRVPAISPDGRYLAYGYEVSGQFEIVVRPFPNVDDARVQVSVDGGFSPVWSQDGSELFYRDRSGQMMAAQVSTTDEFSVTGIEALFPGTSYEFSQTDRRYDVHPDGERFLMVRQQGDELILVNHWLEELRAFMGEGR